MKLELKSQKGLLIIGSFAILCFAVGILIGHLVTSSGEGQSSCKEVESPIKANQDTYMYEAAEEDKWAQEKDLIQTIINRIDPLQLKKNLKYFSEKPHIAGSERDVELATYIHGKFKEAGFDSSEMVPYNLLLSKPNPKNPNKITLHEDGNKIFESQHKEKTIHPQDESPDFVHSFNAFTPAGTVSTKPGEGVVYVNYGRIEDFRKLEELGVNVSGHIAIVRYGKIYRGNKINHAEQFGAVGIIIYSDPEDVALEGTSPDKVYDNTWWLPGSGMQRGSTYLGDGDPLTPGWPSTEHAYRIAEEEADLAKIPSQPIGYDDAKVIIGHLDGIDAPPDWRGKIPGISYKLGPTFKAEHKKVSLVLSTHNANKIEKNFNVIGIIKGSIEPDRYVIIGNHRDAWGFGASDPSSGTAQLMETVRVYGTLLKEGWRPRRSLVFCSWGAEEYGMIGSTEWVEEFIDKLRARTVAYINTDICVTGPMLNVIASPMLWDMFHYITTLVPGVEDPAKTIFDEWKEYSKAIDPKTDEKPIIKNLGSGSDYAAFSILGGIPAGDIMFGHDKTKFNTSTYPYYHTGYETFQMVSTVVDPKFKIQQGCSRVASLTIKYLADSSVIPYSIAYYPEVMLTSLKENKNRQKLVEIYDKYHELENAVGRFLKSAKEFQRKIINGKFRPLELRAINDQQMKLGQSFLIPEGLPGRPQIKNAIFAPSQFDNYASSGFPGLSDLLHEYDSLPEAKRLKRDKEIRRHISDLTIMSDRATATLKEVHLI